MKKEHLIIIGAKKLRIARQNTCHFRWKRLLVEEENRLSLEEDKRVIINIIIGGDQSYWVPL